MLSNLVQVIQSSILFQGMTPRSLSGSWTPRPMPTRRVSWYSQFEKGVLYAKLKSNYEILHFPQKYTTQPLYYICSFSRSPETLLLLVLRALTFPPRWSLPSVEILRMLSSVVNLCSKTIRMSHFQLLNCQNQFGVDLTFSLEGLLSKTQHTYLKCPFTF